MYLETLRDKNSGLEIIPSMKHSGGELGVLGLLLLHCFFCVFRFGTGFQFQRGDIRMRVEVLRLTQRAQYPLIKEYSLNHNMNLYMI